ncbi:cap-specific mRNA (nucleoside-2'-O-)-methyltransferase 2-like [Dreissena polymorpha]|uniref:Cap-specific mRNA (nucleoside-2'-O-)-methyltransferase 2 n=1 Tax=Dreissena polymorpha TaxID=45954 RepID=A0A9D4FKF4_DREPO|nr:cap-specific mRNA (nucleoside-2'-O-)-methyltransferase 2-like [Dreissena polymorpha]KAH3799289.1 hypothetical protein DPMN_152895 [Dreissena polymorpha]
MDSKTKLHLKKRKRESQDTKSKLSLLVQSSIELLFRKQMTYTIEVNNLDGGYENRCLPTVGVSLQEQWTVQKFMDLKQELNNLKTSLNDKDMLTWHAHTRAVNLACKIAPEIRNRLRPELCTQAWCKFYEIASQFLKIQKDAPLFTVHLCEAPGAFVTSLNQYLVTIGYNFDWQWFATTLNPYHEGNNIGQMIDEDRFIRTTFDNWYFGEDQTGNLMNQENMEGLKNRLADVHVDLVTADGSIDCQFDPAEQESVVSRLQHCEVITAMHILGDGGMLVVKMFTLFECTSICLMYLLYRTFEKVSVFKPCTSKGGNSEVYVIGTTYKGRQYCQEVLSTITPWYFGKEDPVGCLFPQSSIPAEFLDKHSEIVEYFTQAQMATIQRNLDLYLGSSEVINEKSRSKLDLEQSYCAECFFSLYDIKPMQPHYRIMRLPKKFGGAAKRQQFGDKVKLEGKFLGSFHERQHLSALPWKQKLVTMETYEENVEVEDNSLWIHSMQGELTDDEVSSYSPLVGQPVTQIHSSKFCKGFFLATARQIVDNTQDMTVYQGVGEGFDAMVTTKLILAVNASLCYLSNTDRYETQPDSNPAFVSPKDDIVCNSNMDTCDNRTDADEKIVCQDEINSRSNETEIGTNLVQSDYGDSFVENQSNSEEVNEMDGKCEGQSCFQGQTDNQGQIGPQGENGGKSQDNKSEIERKVNYNEKRTGLEEIGINCVDISVEKSENMNRDDEEKEKLNYGNETKVFVENPFKATYQAIGDTEYTCKVLQGIAIETETGTPSHHVHLYPAYSGGVDSGFEIRDQCQLYRVVQHILANTIVGESVVIETGLCLTRFSAGLVYILYRSFKEIGFVHCHGQLLRRHLVLMHYRGCPISCQQYLREIGHMIHPDQSDTLLEIIPMLSLLQDADFTRFLETANINLLQSFITSVVNKERQLQLLQT